MKSEMLRSALEYAELGYSVIPLIRGMKKPPKGVTWVDRRFNSADECSDEGWKADHPNVEWGPAGKEQLKQWFGVEHTTANIGILTGAISGIDAIDEDGPHAHETLVAQSGIELPDTVTSVTGRDDGGKQKIFRYHGGGLKSTARFCSNGNGSQCDIRTDGGLIVAPPSIHKSGRQYEWEVDPSIEDPAPFPPELIAFIHERQSKGKTSNQDGTTTKVDYEEYFKNGIPDGAKHHGLFNFACKKISQGLPYPEVLCLTTEVARRSDPPPKDGAEKAAKDRVDQAWAKYGPAAAFDNLDETPADTVQELNQKHAVIMIGGKCVVINQTIDPVFNRPDISFSSKGDFLNMYANRKIPNPLAPTKQISIGKLWWESPDRKQYEGLIFEPQKNFAGYYNLWRGFSVEPIRGAWSLMERLIREAISSGNEARYQYILAWMARIIQDPGGQRPGVAIAMRGDQGIGKGVFANSFGSLIGDHFLQVAQAGQVTGRFNTHMKDCVVLFVDEGFWAGDKQAEGVIKNLVTEPTITVEPKGKDIFKIKNNVNILIASNNDWVVPGGFGERRFFVVDVGDCFKGDYDFFRKLTAQMDNGGRKAMLYDLQKMDISGVNLRDFERTDALLDQIIESMTLVQKWWFDQLRRGSIRIYYDDDRYGGMRDEWPETVSNEALYDAFEIFTKKLKGYLPVPESFGRQLNKLIEPVESIRPRCPNGGPRIRLRVVPNLDRCRKVFEKKLNMQVDWEDEKHEIPPF